MRGSLAWSVLALAIWTTSPVRAAESPAPSGAPAPSGSQYSTQVQGTVPDLTGRWLVVAQVTTGAGAPAGGLASFWSVTAAGGKPQLELRWTKLPPPLEEALQAANKAGRSWEPSVDQLLQLRDAWDTLPPEDRGATTVETTLTGKDAFTDVVKADERLRDAEFLVQSVVSYAPAPARPIKDVLLYGVTGPEQFGYRGNYASVTIAAAPVPIPIALKGTFRIYRLESVQPPGLLRRILDIFGGCGRTRGGDTAR
jgi:hypothetical protein